MARKPIRRAPFVVTVAVAAAAVACGGSVDSDGGAGSGATGGSSGSGGGIGNPPPPPTPTPKTPCPALAPTQNTACSSVGQTCSYTQTDECGSEVAVSAVCAPDAVWDVSYSGPSVSCNPPPPPVETCPVAEPTLGQYCNVISTELCSYPTTCCSNVYQCMDETWVEVSLECNPPAVACPSVAPTTGQACDPCGQTFAPCEYNACSSGGSIIRADCAGGSWTTQKSPCPA